MEDLTKVPVKGFIETSFVDWAGKICSVIFFPKCNFRCCYCHNSELVLKHENLEDLDFESILVRLSDQKVELVDPVNDTVGGHRGPCRMRQCG